MTKEELLKEAEKKYIERLKQDGIEVEYRNETYNDGYLDSAEPREKQIQIDAEQIIALQKQNGELTDKVRELEQQIEKMKKYLDCDYCEYQNNKDECHQCNYLEKTRFVLKKEIKEK